MVDRSKYLDQIDRAEKLEKKGKLREAFSAYLVLAKVGLIDAQTYVAWKYEFGEGVDLDLEQAVLWYSEAAVGGSHHGKFQLAKLYQKMGRYEIAFTTMEELTNEGYLPAIFRIGEMYMKGVGVPRDEELGRYYRKYAAKYGHVWAKRNFAADLIKGTGGLFLIPVGLAKFVIALWDIFWLSAKDPYNTKALV